MSSEEHSVIIHTQIRETKAWSSTKSRGAGGKKEHEVGFNSKGFLQSITEYVIDNWITVLMFH